MSTQPRVRLRIFAIGDDAAILDLADQLLHCRMIEAHHREAVEGDIFDEGAERFLIASKVRNGRDVRDRYW